VLWNGEGKFDLFKLFPNQTSFPLTGIEEGVPSFFNRGRSTPILTFPHRRGKEQEAWLNYTTCINNKWTNYFYC
jgi:hypothetical protein